MLEAATSIGGKNILNLKARNEAIELTWLKGLLAPKDNRPLWTHFALAILATYRKPYPIVSARARISPFLQTWEVSARKVPKTLSRILKVADKYNVCLAAGTLSKDVKNELPAWFHIGANENIKKLNNHFYAPCLRDNHRALSIGHLATITQMLPSEHRKMKTCTCTSCDYARGNLNCKKPFKCFQLAKDILACIPPKWNPESELRPFAENLTLAQVADNQRALKKKEKVMFDPTTILDSPLENGFRSFVEIKEYLPNPARQTAPPPDATHEEIMVVTCGEHRINKDGDIIAGGGVWFGDNDERNRAIRVEEHLATHNSGELSVLLLTAQTIPKHHVLNLTTKTERVVEDLTINLDRWDHTGWLEHENRSVMKALVCELRQRSARTYISRWNTSTPREGKKAAERLAVQGIEKDRSDKIATTMREEFNTNGLRLNHGTQRLFYKGILSTQTPARQKRSTIIHLAITKYAVSDISGTTPTEPQIWNSLRDRDIPRAIRNFLWKVLHNAYKIGEYWQLMANYELRGSCHLCGETETMEHILLECDKSVAITTIWQLSKDLWQKRETTWPTITFGTVMGSQLVMFRDGRNKKIEGKTRLFRILVTEAAHLIWKLRCERAIKFEGRDELFHSSTEIHNRWIASINTRLKTDKLLANPAKYGKKAIKPELVLKTWSGVLMDEHDLPDDWIRQTGVLVGIAPRRPPGRNR
ncbi:hypothetical protein BU15DRAFT_52534 [Melanogaster broomeanus]|nr:hypothetical protein BU15DRAFT_52534 [Melanogaster broomeanus]